MTIFIGCAGWNLRKEFADLFPLVGTHLERYSGRLNAVELNSSFYRPHRLATYHRWAASTPSDFSFAVKLPKQITHVCRLAGAGPQIEQFRLETSGLGEKLGAILVQLPPSLEFDGPVAECFFRDLREQWPHTPIVCEPRHPSWFASEAESLLNEKAIGRVAADPSIVPGGASRGGCRRVDYFRWHGSPRMYYSSYDDQALDELAEQIRRASKVADRVWCVFDNTAEGAALCNALALREILMPATAIE
ncbi:MAG: DUF72 domain-containing protein [Planctomycetes bacterium]|nr:DUF72 domain-containing protein [Planctomycetota bacterium]